jgi:HNH endonuclease
MGQGLWNEREFWERVRRSPGCWEWTGRANPYPYVSWRGRNMRAHRVAWELKTGQEAPARSSGLVVLHSCDNPRCVRPEHLSLSTQAENMRQRSERGRATPGRHSKLLWSQVEEIRAAIKDGASHRELAPRYGVSIAAISHIRTGKTWRN